MFQDGLKLAQDPTETEAEATPEKQPPKWLHVNAMNLNANINCAYVQVAMLRNSDYDHRCRELCDESRHRYWL